MKNFFHKSLTVTQQNVRRCFWAFIFLLAFAFSLIFIFENHVAFVISIIFSMLQIIMVFKNETLSELFFNISIISFFISLRFFDFFIKENMLFLLNFWALVFFLSFICALTIKIIGNLEIRPYISDLQKVILTTSKNELNLDSIYSACLNIPENFNFKKNFYSLENKKQKSIYEHFLLFIMKQELCDIADTFFFDNSKILGEPNFYEVCNFIIRKID